MVQELDDAVEGRQFTWIRQNDVDVQDSTCVT